MIENLNNPTQIEHKIQEALRQDHESNIKVEFLKEYTEKLENILNETDPLLFYSLHVE